MRLIYSVLVIVMFALPVHAADLDFSDILNRVQLREERTKAIMKVNTSEEEKKETGLSQFHHFEMSLTEGQVKVEMYNNYMTGRKGVTYFFDLAGAVKEEWEKYNNYSQLLILDKGVAEAERKRRVYVNSNFQLNAGSSSAEVEKLFGKEYKVNQWQAAGWSTRIYSNYSVTMFMDSVHDIT